ncbi:TonB-linked SusC/RagA family outer membrane protein [Lewinella marina]|uniref:SusC/RagA family TonB-linked outer membrane protein n=1 Tax=Neolewinella marina TaxID=438751 RepID=A0A2G0CCE4_9BACT|nr:TonB-dependent receptor [Neolewinella marina]NJB87713.1 TonB-linked SusC/RagA family outer membrane protein [Neolewinella marina]PHK97610.1 SusC/RagA family TonB-linked outer membrane protein [Neolewinella marina]
MRISLFLLLWCSLTAVSAANLPPGTLAPLVEITGIVTDESGMPLIGATILEEGTTNGTVTDLDGRFSIDVKSDDPHLVVTYTGYQSQIIQVGSQTNFEIVMLEDSETLDEVVVVGYGIQKKRDVTASISSLNDEQIKKIATSSGVDAMQGQVSGVDIVSGGGRPGANPSIRIRGRRSLSASNDPLFVIDGIPQTSGTSAIADINPQDIESMEILKDAAGTAIYGSRGSNGVVIITTKRGSAGRTIVSYDGYYGGTSASNTVDMMNGEEFAAMKRESQRDGWNGAIPPDETVFQDPTELESIAMGRSTDFQDLVLNDGWQMNHQLGVRGGTEATQFNISLGYFDEQGIISNMDFKRYTARVNLDQKIGSIFKAGISFTLSNSLQNYGSNATLGEALANNPLGVPYNEDGSVRFLPTNDGIRTNPLSELVENAYIDDRRVTRLFAPIYLKADLMPGLVFTTNFGPDIRYYRRGEFRGSFTNDNRGGPADAGITNSQDFGYTWENILNYNRTIGEGNDLGLTFLQSIQALRYEQNSVDVLNLPYEEQMFYNIGTAEVKGDLSSTLSEWQLASFMGRANYSIQNKYLVQVSLRADGSSRLAKGNQWNYFPGFSLGWRVGEEGFLDGAGWLNDLKLRVSYGEVGNTAVSPYSTQGALQRTVYAWDESPAFGFALRDIPNAELSWEVSKTLNAGVDFDILNGRVNGSFEIYRTNTEDILLARNLPPTSGYSSVLQNIGSTQTKGAELVLGAGILRNPTGLSWDVDFNISGYRESITELALTDDEGNPIDDVGNGWFIGQPLNVFYDYNKIGIYQANEVELADSRENKVPGEIKLEDIDGDGVITPADRVILGSDVPDFFGGLTNRFEYRGVDLSIFFFFRQGQMISSNFHRGNNSLFARYNNLDVDYWTIDNPTNANPRPNENQESPRNGSTLSYFDGSFVKLRNVQLGYNLPDNVVSRIGLSRLRFYVSGQNLWFSSDYDTYDPETQDIIPTTKIILGGLRATF